MPSGGYLFTKKTYRVSSHSIYLKKAEELIGTTFYRLTITSIIPLKGRFRCTAICICGKLKEYAMGHIRNGATKSCGCIVREVSGKNNLTHGLSKHPLYRVWKGIRTRCYNKKFPHYKYYGAKGIKMCEEWRSDFKAFYDWAMRHNWEKRMNIDRYPDRVGDYCPENCRVVTPTENMNNRDDNRKIEIDGKIFTMKEVASMYNMAYTTLQGRLLRGIDINDALYS